MLLDSGSQKLKLIVNTLVLGISLYGISNTTISKDDSYSFENLMIDTFAPIQRSVTYLYDSFSKTFDFYLANINASKENIELKKTVSILEKKIFTLNEVSKENERLKSLLEFGKDVPYKKVLAQIVAWDSSSDFRVLRVNKGYAHGIKLQSTVVTSSGLVGYVYRMTDNFSDILTILDSNNRVDSIVSRTRSHGIIEGNTEDRCIMKYVTRSEPIILNDIVVTSGFGNIYPKGIRVGFVTKIERETYGITQSVEVTPSVNFSRLEEVVILVADNNIQRQSEWQALDESGGEQ